MLNWYGNGAIEMVRVRITMADGGDARVLRGMTN